MDACDGFACASSSSSAEVAEEESESSESSSMRRKSRRGAPPRLAPAHALGVHEHVRRFLVVLIAGIVVNWVVFHPREPPDLTRSCIVLTAAW